MSKVVILEGSFLISEEGIPLLKYIQPIDSDYVSKIGYVYSVKDNNSMEVKLLDSSQILPAKKPLEVGNHLANSDDIPF